MQESIHPGYQQITITCSCGEVFTTGSTLSNNLAIEVCAKCHPFYTGKQKGFDSSSRAQKFRDRYNRA